MLPALKRQDGVRVSGPCPAARTRLLFCNRMQSRVVTGLAVVSSAVPVGNVSWILFQEGRSSIFKLRRGVGQASHTVIPTSSVLEFIRHKQ